MMLYKYQLSPKLAFTFTLLDTNEYFYVTPSTTIPLPINDLLYIQE